MCKIDTEEPEQQSRNRWQDKANIQEFQNVYNKDNGILR